MASQARRPSLRNLRRSPAFALWSTVLLGCSGENLILPREGVPATVTALSGDAQADTVGHPLPAPIVFLLADATGRPVARQAIAFLPGANTTAARLIPDTGTTDVDGHVSLRWVLGEQRGPQTVRAQVLGPRSIFVDVGAVATADAPAMMLRVSGDSQQGAAGTPLGAPLVVRLTDRFGNGIPGVPVSWTTATGGGSTAPLADTLDAGGTAEAVLVLGPSAGRNAVTARAAGFSVLFTATAEFISGAAAIARIMAQPSPTSLNTVAFATQPSVLVTDVDGQPVAHVPVLAAVGSGGGVLSGSTTVLTDGSGIATFVDLALTGLAGQRTLTFTAGAASATSAAITIVPGPATAAHSGVLVPNGNAGAATLVTITTRDASGNATTIPAGITVGVSGANSFVPAVTDHHDGTYTASYAPTHSGTDLVSVTLAGTAVLGSPWASVVHAGPVSSTLSTLQLVPAQVVASSGAEQATVTVVARDGYGNGVPGVTVGLSASGFSNTFAPLAPLTDPSGSAVSHFSSTLAGSRTVTATIGGVSWTQNVTVVAGPADPRQSGATVPGSAHRHQFTVMALQTRDQFGNTLTTGGHTVSFSVTGANHAGPLNAVDIGDGSYVMSYLPSSKGTDTIAILLDGVPVQGSPYRSNVH